MTTSSVLHVRCKDVNETPCVISRKILHHISCSFLKIERFQKLLKSVEFSKCFVHQILGPFLLLDFKNIDVM